MAEKLRLRDEHLARMTADWSDRDRDRFAELFDRFTADFAATVNDQHFQPARPATRTEKS